MRIESEPGVNLGYPLPRHGGTDWCLVVTRGETQAQVLPVAFNEAQAREIARRITEFYGNPK